MPKSDKSQKDKVTVISPVDMDFTVNDFHVQLLANQPAEIPSWVATTVQERIRENAELQKRTAGVPAYFEA